MLAVVLHAVAALALWWLAEHAPTITPQGRADRGHDRAIAAQATASAATAGPTETDTASAARRHQAAGGVGGRQGDERPALGRGAERYRRAAAALARGDGAQAGGPAETANQTRDGGAQSAVTRAAAGPADPAAVAEAGAGPDGGTPAAAPAYAAGREAAARRGASSAAAATGAASTLGDAAPAAKSLARGSARSPIAAARREHKHHGRAPARHRRRCARCSLSGIPRRRRSRVRLAGGEQAARLPLSRRRAGEGGHDRGAGRHSARRPIARCAGRAADGASFPRWTRACSLASARVRPMRRYRRRFRVQARASGCRWSRCRTSADVFAGSAPLRQARRFFFLVDTQISNAAASDSLGNLAPERQRPRIRRSQRAHYGQWPAIRGP